MYRHLRIFRSNSRDRVRNTAVFLFEDTKQLPAGCRQLDREHGSILSAAIQRSEFSTKLGAITTLYTHPDSSRKQSRLYVVGLGNRQDGVATALRFGATRLLPAVAKAKVTHLILHLAKGLIPGLDAKGVGQAIADGLSIANFDFDDFKGLASKDSQKTTHLKLEAPEPFRAGLQKGLKIGESANFARNLAATPPNVANVTYLVRTCRKMARQVGLRCTVIDVRRAAQLKMGGLLAVGSAGSTPPALICLEYHPPNAKKVPPIMLVGKAVTFDTGGYSIKQASGMEGMKYDKCGGTTVIGAMHAIARLKLPVPVVGLVAAAENLISEKAYRPGDIIKMYNGVTVEITNTDAEGRLVLADALAYGSKRYQPRGVIDLATLTGGVVVALGSGCAGGFCADSKLRDCLMDAGQTTGERVWFLPLWPEHRKQLKSAHADIVNSAGREAHAIQGAAFLSHFVDVGSPLALPKTPWVHLDIAGVSDVNGGEALLYGKGPTGFGVRLVVESIESWRAQPQG